MVGKTVVYTNANGVQSAGIIGFVHADGTADISYLNTVPVHVSSTMLWVSNVPQGTGPNTWTLV